MPWPTKSRTTEKPLRLDVRLHRVRRCPTPPPARTRRSFPVAATASVTSSSRCASAVTRPDRQGHGGVAVEAVQLHAESIETMSPSTSGRDPGMPCTTCSFTETQIVAGYPW